jgi:hypothetical protein
VLETTEGDGGLTTFSGHPCQTRVKTFFNDFHRVQHIETTSLLPGLVQPPIVEMLLVLLKNWVGARKRYSSRESKYGWIHRLNGFLIPERRKKIKCLS